AGNADAADQHVAAVDRCAAREDLDAVRDALDASAVLRHVAERWQVGAVERHGKARLLQVEREMQRESVVDEVELLADLERAPLREREAERSGRIAVDAIG